MLITWNCLIIKIKVITSKSEFYIIAHASNEPNKRSWDCERRPTVDYLLRARCDPLRRTLSVADTSGRRLVKAAEKSRANDEATAEVPA